MTETPLGEISPCGAGYFACYNPKTNGQARAMEVNAMGIEANPRIKFRYEDYKSLPESETCRYELLDGELVRVPPPSEYHQRLSRNLGFFLWQYVKKHDLGQVYDVPLDVVLGEGIGREIVQPDIFYIAKTHSSIITDCRDEAET